MSRRKARIVILCEDIQHATFLRRVLYEYGWTYHDLEVKKCPEGKRDAKQYIRTEYPHEVTAFRSKKNKINLCLFIVIDADNNTVDERKQELDSCLTSSNPKLEKRSPDDKIVILVPKRNVETWTYYLLGKNAEINETKAYPKLKKQKECQPAA